MTAAPFCCSWLREKATVDCGHHTSPWDCTDVMVVWSEQSGEFGLPVRDGGQSFIVISHCPWCGTRLPTDDTVDDDTCSVCGCELSGAGECWWCGPSVDEWARRREQLYDESRDHGSDKGNADAWAEAETIRRHGPQPPGPMRPFGPWLADMPATYDLSWHDQWEVAMHVPDRVRSERGQEA